MSEQTGHPGHGCGCEGCKWFAWCYDVDCRADGYDDVDDRDDRHSRYCDCWECP